MTSCIWKDCINKKGPESLRFQAFVFLQEPDQFWATGFTSGVTRRMVTRRFCCSGPSVWTFR